MKRFSLLLLSSVFFFGLNTSLPGFVEANSLGRHSVVPAGGRNNGKGKGFHVDHNFNGKDGGFPTAALVQDSAGNLYGTTSAGGSGFGVVFELDTSNHETVVYAFSGPDGST